MSRSVNRITLIGNVGRDPEVHTTQRGTKVAHVTLATSRRLPRRDGAEKGEEVTDWHRLTFWNRLGEFVEEHVGTGDRLYIEGRMEYGSYDRDGVTIPTADVNVQEVVLLTPRESRRG